jgi:hypothetical protein
LNTFNDNQQRLFDKLSCKNYRIAFVIEIQTFSASVIENDASVLLQDFDLLYNLNNKKSTTFGIVTDAITDNYTLLSGRLIDNHCRTSSVFNSSAGLRTIAIACITTSRVQPHRTAVLITSSSFVSSVVWKSPVE